MQTTFDARKITGYVFIGISAVFVFYVSTTICFSTKYWLLEPDPTFPYLLNGLNIATLHGVGHTDHPGTVLQILCAILLRIFYFCVPDANTNDIVRSVLSNPEWYLKNIYISFFAIQSIILAAVAARIWSSFNNVTLLIVILTGLFVSPQLLSMQADSLRPEILIPSLLLLLTLATLKRWRENTLNPPIPSRTLTWSAGALAGAALFTKATCFPVFCVSFLFWKDWKSRWYYVAGFACIALICLPLIWPKLYETLSWFSSLALHEGKYGSGSATILSPTLFTANITTILSSNISTAALLALTIAGLFVYRKERHSLGWKIAALYMLSIIIIVALVAKHYAQHYLIAVYITAFFVPFVYIAQTKKVYLKLVTCIFCVFLFFVSCNTLYNKSNAIDKSAFTGNSFHYDDTIFQNYTIVESYRTYTKIYALSFGNTYSNGQYGELLRSIYTHCFEYNIWNKQFYHFQKHVSFEEIASSGRPVIIRGTNLKRDNYGKNLILGKEITAFPEGDVMYEFSGVK